MNKSVQGNFQICIRVPLNQNDKQQTSLDGINETKIGLMEMKDNSSNKLIVGHLTHFRPMFRLFRNQVVGFY